MAGDSIGAVEVSDDLWRISVPLPEATRPAATNVYVLRDVEGGLHLVDAGWDTPEAWATLLQGLRGIDHRVTDVRSVVVTHLHRDHRGLTDRIRDASGAVIGMHVQDVAAQGLSRNAGEGDLERWRVPVQDRRDLLTAAPEVQPVSTMDRILRDDDRWDAPGWQLTVLHTPGHTAGTICLVAPDRRIIFTGDHVLPEQFPGIGLGGIEPIGSNALHEYGRSLERLDPFGGWLGLPGHGEPMRDLKLRIQEIKHHQTARTAELRGVRECHPDASVWDIAANAGWSSGWTRLSPWHRVSALRQTEMHLSASCPANAGVI